MKTGLFIIILLVTAILITLVALYFIYNNAEIRLRRESEAQREKIKGVFDKMWKVIKQKTQVTDEYRKSFEKIYPKLIAGRYENEGKDMMKWINEDNPELRTALYEDLVRAIEVLRGEFQHSQERMLDIIREHSSLCNTYPAKWFISDRSRIEYNMMLSDTTNSVIASCVENDVELSFSE